jgi:hypothetical protein
VWNEVTKIRLVGMIQGRRRRILLEDQDLEEAVAVEEGDLEIVEEGEGGWALLMISGVVIILLSTAFV